MAHDVSPVAMFIVDEIQIRLRSVIRFQQRGYCKKFTAEKLLKFPLGWFCLELLARKSQSLFKSL